MGPLMGLVLGEKLGEGILGAFGAYKKKETRKKIEEKEEQRMNAAIQALGLKREQYVEDWKRSREALLQSYANRGLSDSSIKEQGMFRQQRQADRIMMDFNIRERSAWLAFEMFKLGQQSRDYQEILGLGQNVLGAEAGLTSWLMEMGGGGGGGGVGPGAPGAVPPW